MKRTLLLTLSVLLFVPPSVLAQEATTKDYDKGWYIGVQAGMPMAEGTFSSFGADKFRAGWNAGLHGGYRFSRVWSLELTANWGQQFLAEQDCCYERGYFLGSDWKRYHPTLVTDGMVGAYYKDLTSCVFAQRYGLQLNMNLLGFFKKLKDSRWRLDISPAIYGVGTSSDIRTKVGKSPIRENIDNWHFGYGGNAQVLYALTKNLNLGIYGGFTHLTGAPIDGMPRIHLTNFMIDAGVKLSWNFGRKSRKSTAAATVTAAATALVTSKATATTVAIPATQAPQTPTAPTPQTAVAQMQNNPATTTRPTAETVQTLQSAAQPQSAVPATVSTLANSTNPTPVPVGQTVTERNFPIIYFSFNSIWIEPSERAKVKAIADRMKADKSIRIRVTGWGDEVGGEAVNKRVSLQRAETMKRVLGQWLIPADRIEVVGGGINRTTTSRKEARNATTVEIIE